MEKQEFTQLLCSESVALKKHAYRFTRNQADAQDLMQDTLLKALSHWERFEEGSNLQAWLYVIMRNIFINSTKRQITKKVEIDHVVFSERDYPRISTVNPGELNYDLRVVKREVEKLPKRYATPLMMFLDGKKYTEITDSLEVPLGTIKIRIFTARKILNNKLRFLKPLLIESFAS